MRYFIDEQSLCSPGDLAWRQVERDLEGLAEILSELRSMGEPVGLLAGWPGLEIQPGHDLVTVLASAGFIDRDVRVRLLQAFDKCVAWDEDPAVAVEGAVSVGGVTYESLGVGRALQLAAEGRATAVVATPWADRHGWLPVAAAGEVAVDLCFIVVDADLRRFLRSLFALDDVAEADFFGLAAEAFPALCFAEKLAFRRFAGGYVNRDAVVRHLAALNDQFADLYVEFHGNSARISARLGVPVSIEGNTRASKKLMRERDAVYDGQDFRCEWHSKIEPHRNRIHFHPGDERTQGRLLIGIFVEHLNT
ncbi:hypothetical protein MXD62_12915 [Frankia sp. Mgl5]|uniref:hypothetical protein n=1 Tax=Frankia sp. Mgl5 TaxID=2933793 RepID=UPI0020106E21|nr:hypothetical protein [Frankia sp. Mgl5]MCK9928064.1 hypothetical protein [Frankia sp. Mgl5]